MTQAECRSWVWAAVVAALLGPFAGAATARAEPAPDSLDVLLDRAAAGGFSPGIAIAVVRGDRIVWSAVRGVADLETKRPLAPDTRFYIASTTKALTALAAARLAARGALDLDAPLSRALPGIRLHAGLAADSIRVRDLLTHTHGIDPDGPVSVRVAYTGDFDRRGLLESLATQGPAATGRAFAYSNLGYDLLGLVLDPAHDRGWKQVVEREVTRPLAMHATTAYRSRVPRDRLAMPHGDGPSGAERIALAKQDANMGPAGGLFSTAPDLARLVVAELNGGRVDGRTCIPAGVIRETQRALVPQARTLAGYRRVAWGLGWDLGLLEGDTLVHRFGEFPGYSSHVSFLPAHGVGVVVLCNGGHGGAMLADAVAWSVYDRLLGRPDAAARIASRFDTLATRESALRRAVAANRAQRAARSQALPHPLGDYAGTYANPAWGTLHLRVREGRLEAAMGVARSAVEVYDAATNKLRVELFGGGSVLEAVFAPGAGPAREVRLEGASFVRR